MRYKRMHNYKELKVWNKAVEFATAVYKSTESLPSEERFGLTSQIRRSVVSVSSNIAEGAGRNTKGEFNQFLGFAYGSLCELDTQIIIARELKYVEQEIFESLTEEIKSLQKMVFNLKRSIS